MIYFPYSRTSNKSGRKMVEMTNEARANDGGTIGFQDKWLKGQSKVGQILVGQIVVRKNQRRTIYDGWEK